MSDCINYYFIRDVDKISEHVFSIHNVERARERESMKVKKATPLMEPKK